MIKTSARTHSIAASHPVGGREIVVGPAGIREECLMQSYANSIPPAFSQPAGLPAQFGRFERLLDIVRWLEGGSEKQEKAMYAPLNFNTAAPRALRPMATFAPQIAFE